MWGQPSDSALHHWSSATTPFVSSSTTARNQDTSMCDEDNCELYNEYFASSRLSARWTVLYRMRLYAPSQVAYAPPPVEWNETLIIARSTRSPCARQNNPLHVSPPHIQVLESRRTWWDKWSLDSIVAFGLNVAWCLAVLA